MTVNVRMENKGINFKLDSDAQANVLPLSLLQKLRKTVNLHWTVIVIQRIKPILGLKACKEMHLIKRINGVEAVNIDDNKDDLLLL